MAERYLVSPAKAGVHVAFAAVDGVKHMDSGLRRNDKWIPAFAGMTMGSGVRRNDNAWVARFRVDRDIVADHDRRGLPIGDGPFFNGATLQAGLQLGAINS